ncbi:copper amine oxidase N-terminal domain-containing protein [Paenibacillus piri]|nr:copper amine oxidase N-terminal domain-containing protein [Paenibacillus piri]
MKSVLKKSLAILTLSATLMSAGAAYASTNGDPGPAALSPSASQSEQAPVRIKINGEPVAETGYLTSDGDEPMIPLRIVAEKLGFTLTWKQETLSVDIQKGQLFTTVTTGEDRYTINRMLTSLGTVPALVNNKLYVPASFVNKVLHGFAVTEGSTVSITEEEGQKNSRTTGVVTAITYKDRYRSVHIQGTGMNGMVLNIGEDTVVQKKDGAKLAFSDLHVGLTVEAEHSNAATLSLPPQTPTYKITVLDEPMKSADALGTAGEISEVRRDEKGAVSLVIEGSGLTEQSPGEVVLRLTDETPVINMSGKAVDRSKLVQGTKVVGVYGPVLTRSLPPIGSAWKIIVDAKDE